MAQQNVRNGQVLFNCSNDIEKYDCSMCPNFQTNFLASLKSHNRDSHTRKSVREDVYIGIATIKQEMQRNEDFDMISLQNNPEEAVAVASFGPPQGVKAAPECTLLSRALSGGGQNARPKTPPPQRNAATRESLLESLVTACSSFGDTLNTFLTPQEEDEDYHFAVSFVKSFGKMKNNKKKQLVKSKVYALLAEAADGR